MTQIEALASKLETRAQFHARNCKGSYSYFSDIDGQTMLDAATALRHIQKEIQELCDEAPMEVSAWSEAVRRSLACPLQEQRGGE